jgi:hypothetical protein
VGGKGASLSFTGFAGRLDQRGAAYYIVPDFRWSPWKATTSVSAECKVAHHAMPIDDARGDGLAGVASGLDDVVFKDGGAAEDAENADGEDGDGDGGGNRKTRPKTHVDRDHAKDDAKDGAEKDGAEGEFRRVLIRRNKRMKFWHGQPPRKRKPSCGFFPEGGV